METVIEVKKMMKSFQDKKVLKGVDLKVNKGDVVAIVGASGSGKSTLIRCIAGLEDTQSGELVLKGKKINNRNEAVGTIGMVFQNFNLFPHYTVEENIVKPLMTVKKMKADEAKETAKYMNDKTAHYEAILAGLAPDDTDLKN